MLSAELTRRRKQSLKNTIRGGGPLRYENWYLKWQTAFLEKNKDMLVDIIKEYKYPILLAAQFAPQPFKSIITTIANAPKASIEVQLAISKLLLYDPSSIFGL